MRGGDRQLVGVEPRPGVARAAVDRGLQVELSDTLDLPTRKIATRLPVRGASIWRSRNSGEKRMVSSSGSSTLRSAVAFSSQETLVLGQQPVASPDPAHTASRDLETLDPSSTVQFTK